MKIKFINFEKNVVPYINAKKIIPTNNPAFELPAISIVSKIILNSLFSKIPS